MTYSRWTVGLAVILMAWSLPLAQEVHAEVPPSMTHQGRLLDDDGAPISGNIELSYTLYDSPTGGTILWQDELTATVSESGFYSVELGGSSNPINAMVLSDGEAWMGVAVDGGSELTPRITLSSVPFALIAERAASAQTADTAQTAINVQNGSITNAALADDFSVTIEADQITEITGDTLGGLSCASGEIARFDGSGWACDTEASVSFGTTAGTAAEGNDPRLSDERDPTSDSDHYIQNQAASPQDASFNIGGNAHVQGNLVVPEWPVASGYTTSNHSAGDRIEYENVWVNNGGHYDHLTGYFTAPVRGIYEMCASTRRDGSGWTMLNTRIEDDFIVGGAGSRWLQAADGNGRQNTGCISFEVQAGERVANFVGSSHSAMTCTSQAYCFFNIKLIAALE